MHLSPLPPAAAALQNFCDPLGMCLGNYRLDRTRGPSQELGEAQAEGGPKPQSPQAGTVVTEFSEDRQQGQLKLIVTL